MEVSDFIEWLGPDMAMKVLLSLDDPADLVRFSAVSSYWHKFVIANGLAKQLFLRKYPEASSASCIIDAKNVIEPVESSDNDSAEWACLKRDHRVYAFLAQGLTSFTVKESISDAIYATSTDNYPEESILNTLEPSDKVGSRASYWSSKGESDPAIPERLIYKLVARLCLVTEIHVHPFQAYFQFGFPIYSAKAVRFRMGYPKNPKELEIDDEEENFHVQDFPEDKFVWTYTSPEFPMVQENILQKFKLPEPVFCVGGILQVELLGRVQTQEMDGLYYICISHVQAVGRPLAPAFDLKILDQSGRCSLEYHPEAAGSDSTCPQGSSPSRFHRFSASIRGWEQMILNTLLGAGGVVVDDDDSGNESVE